MRGLTKKRSFGGHNATHEPLSLADFGYVDVGLDAGYVASNTGYDGTCHTKSGHLLIDETKFPSLKSMTSMAHSLNLTASWYLNLDGGCNGSKEVEVGPTYTTDSADAVTYGFDGVKFDSEPGGPSHNITLWAMALTSAAKAAGKSEGMMIENCQVSYPEWIEFCAPAALLTTDWLQDKNPTYLLDDPTDCPYNFYRTGPDNSPSFFGLIYHVFNYAVPYLQVTDPVPASRPHCWAYPDGLGIGSPVKGTTSWAAARANGCANMTIAEERTLFANWAIVSSPIILSIDARDDAEVEKYWPIVTNRRALQINDGWAGSAGSLLKQSAQTTNRSTPVGASCNNIHIYKDIPNWLLYVKPLPGGEVAALAINSGERALAATDNVALTLDELIAIVAKASVGVWPTSTPPTTFTAVDVWSGAALPIVTATNPWSAVG